MRRHVEESDPHLLDAGTAPTKEIFHRSRQGISTVRFEIVEGNAAIPKVSRKPDAKLRLLRDANLKGKVPSLDGRRQLGKRQCARPVPRLVLHTGPADIRRGKRLHFAPVGAPFRRFRERRPRGFHLTRFAILIQRDFLTHLRKTRKGQYGPHQGCTP